MSGLLRNNPVRRDEHAMVFDTTAWFDESNQTWTVPIHGWLRGTARSVVRKAAIAQLLKSTYGLETDDTTTQNFDRRTQLFLHDNVRGRRLQVRIGKETYEIPPSDRHGHFQRELVLDAKTVDQSSRHGTLPVAVVLQEGDPRSFSGEVHLIQPEGISVISDIDDTVKNTCATDRKEMLERSLFRDFEAVPGMAKAYRAWAKAGASLHFVSSSPWQLYEPLREFLTASGFPDASYHLKDMHLTDRSFLNIFRPGTETKPAQIVPLLQAYPRRRFVLVGDSGEKDPEIYGDMARRAPEQIARIYIHNVTGEKASTERFQRAFAGVDRAIWDLFTDPETLSLPVYKPE